jgi:2-polyprenyl-3-methyl-5-hydroxy-6-metoxy-1,4-benzoquinol methylase
MAEKEDLARVLSRLKEEIRRHKPQDTEALPAEKTISLRRVYATTYVNPHLPIGWPELPSGILPKIAAMVQKVVRRLLRWYINPIVEQQNAYNSAVTTVLQSMVQQIEALKQYQGEVEIAKLRLQRLERGARTVQAPATVAIDRARVPPAALTGPALDYFQLELKFRGPHLLRERHKPYLEHFRGCQNVLDIGCGRGEFVSMLVQSGTQARGIDLDADAVAYAQERGIPVEQAEATAYLQGLPDGSLDGVFAAQVVEHLQPRNLAQLLQLCHDKMLDNAPIVLETLNPTCLWSMANWFVIDPTHVWPIHSETLKFMLENAGFWKIECHFLSPMPVDGRLLTFPEQATFKSTDPEVVALLNHNIARLNQFLFGYQDYAVIARRPPRDVGEQA